MTLFCLVLQHMVIMVNVAPFLILLICISGTYASPCDSHFIKLFSYTGAVVTELPAVSTIVNLINALLSNECVGKSVLEIAANEDRRQEARNAASQLKGYLTNIKEIRSYDDLKGRFNVYDNLRLRFRENRLKWFDSFDHHHESKFKLFTEYASVELTLIDMMINSNPGSSTKARLEKAYGDTILYYIEKGGEMFSYFPVKLAHNGDNHRAMEIMNRQDRSILRTSLINWMETVETKPEVMFKRLSHKGTFYIIDYSTDVWILLLGYKKASYLPIILRDGDWIAFKRMDTALNVKGPATWLGCHDSISEDKYCTKTAKCPGIMGNQDNNECKGEKFRIQVATRSGPWRSVTPKSRIKLKWDRHLGYTNKEIAFQYWDWDCSSGSRGKNTYWLSSHTKSLRDYGSFATLPCPGSSFTEADISRCKHEVFTLSVPLMDQSDPGSFRFEGHFLRNGDYVNVSNGSGYFFFKGTPATFIQFLRLLDRY